MLKLTARLLPLVMLLICSGIWVRATADIENSPLVMARYFPQDTTFFLSVSLKQDFIDNIDGLVASFSDDLQEFHVPRVTLKLAVQLASGVHIDSALQWLGDFAAVGLPASPASSPLMGDGAYGIILIDDVDGADQFLTKYMAGFARQTVDNIIFYINSSAVIELRPDMMLIYAVGQEPELPLISTLLDSPQFNTAATYLPQSSYDFNYYLDNSMLIEWMATLNSSLTGIASDYSSKILLGLSLIKGDTLLGDSVQISENISPIFATHKANLEFLDYVPDTMSTVMLINDISGLYQGMVPMQDELAQAMNYAELPSQQLETQLAEYGIDLQTDILDWMTGDIAIFAQMDTIPIVTYMLAKRLNVNSNIQFGMLIDAKANPDAAKRFTDKLVSIIQNNLPLEDVTIYQDEIAGNRVWIIEVHTMVNDPFAPPICDGSLVANQPINFDYVVGANETYAFMGTRPLIELILNGDAKSIRETQFFQGVNQYLLPNTYALGFATGEGIIFSFAGMPLWAIASLSQSFCQLRIMTDVLNGTPTADVVPPMPTIVPTVPPDMNQVQDLLKLYIFFLEKFQYGTLSQTIHAEGIQGTRFTLTIRR